MKRIFGLLFGLLLFGCGKDDGCDCKIYEPLGIYIPEEYFQMTDAEFAGFISIITDEQLDYLDTQCRKKCN